MSTSPRFRCAPVLAGVAFVLLTGGLVAQTPAPPPPPSAALPSVTLPTPGLDSSAMRRRVVLAASQPGQPGSSGAPFAFLTRNYLVQLVVKNGEAEETIEVLTASPSLSFNGVLGKSPATVITFSGTMMETEEGSLVLQYSIGGRVPEVVESGGSALGGAVATQVGGTVATRVEYKDETSTGAIHVTPGVAQTVLKSGQRSYSVLIAPAKTP